MTDNQNPEQKARDNIDELLRLSGWVVQHSKQMDFSAGVGIAARNMHRKERAIYEQTT